MSLGRTDALSRAESRSETAMNKFARIGLMVVVLAILCFVASEVFRRHPELLVHRKAIGACIAGAGTMLWLVAKVHGSSDDAIEKPNRVLTVSFFGMVIAGLGAVITFSAPISQIVSSPQTFIRAHASEHLARLPELFRAQNSAIVARAEKARGNNSLQIQGIFYKTTDPSAIINGQTVFVGDHVGPARVVAIERESVTIEVAQEKKILAFRM
jgi:hypothetical protein